MHIHNFCIFRTTKTVYGHKMRRRSKIWKSFTHLTFRNIPTQFYLQKLLPQVTTTIYTIFLDLTAELFCSLSFKLNVVNSSFARRNLTWLLVFYAKLINQSFLVEKLRYHSWKCENKNSWSLHLKPCDKRVPSWRLVRLSDFLHNAHASKQSVNKLVLSSGWGSNYANLCVFMLTASLREIDFFISKASSYCVCHEESWQQLSWITVLSWLTYESSLNPWLTKVWSWMRQFLHESCMCS